MSAMIYTLVSHYTFAEGFFKGKFSHGFPLGKNQSKWLDLQFESAYYKISIHISQHS